jgi:3-oxoacyl-[acyl-carrier protein] reductase
MTTPLEGKTALVTGAHRGIGRAIALQVAAAGVTVALVARSQDQLAETAERVKELGGAALVVPSDLCDLQQVAHAIQRTNDEMGIVDVLINDAAVVGPLGPIVSVDPNEWAAAVGVNVVAVAPLSFALAPGMVAGNWGRIVNVSSRVASHTGAMIGMNAYAAGKAASEVHTINLAAELSGRGITVNASARFGRRWRARVGPGPRPGAGSALSRARPVFSLLSGRPDLSRAVGLDAAPLISGVPGEIWKVPSPPSNSRSGLSGRRA